MLRVSQIALPSGISFSPEALTVVIGPNNGGKSRFLKDIKTSLTTPRSPMQSISEIGIDALPTWHGALDRVAANLKNDENGNLIFDRLDVDLVQAHQRRYLHADLRSYMVAAPRQGNDQQQLSAQEIFGSLFLANLGTSERLDLVNRQTKASPNVSGPGSVAAALRDAAPRVSEWINKQIRDAFGCDLLVDDSEPFQVGLVLGDASSVTDHYLKRRDELSKLPRAEDQGDGIRAFCGVVTAVATTDRSIVLIDEPEAFLHPPQALLMGRALARLESIGVQVFVATHSAEILRGIIGENSDVQVLRLSQTASGFHSKLIPTQQIKNISNDPLLSSARVLDGLFYQGVVIADSDADVAIYRRVLEDFDGSGSVHFLNAYGKSAAIKMTTPYRTMAIGHAVIVDFDILRDGNEFRRLVEVLGGQWADFSSDYQAFLDEIEAADRPADRVASADVAIQELTAIIRSDRPYRERLEALRYPLRSVKEKASVWSELKRRGRDGLSSDGKVIFDAVEACSAKIGLFIVPCGERESWLPGIVDYSRNKPAWTEEALAALAAGKLQDDHPLRAFMLRVRKFVLA